MKKTLVIALCFLLLVSTVLTSVSCDNFTLDGPTETDTKAPAESAKPTESELQTDFTEASEAPNATETPTESETVTGSETPVVTDAPTESETVTESETPVVTVAPTESETVTEIETPVVTVAPTESETVTESETPVVTVAPTESETVTESETPTATEAPTETETEAHVHSFDVKDTSEDYLKSEATCLKPAYYYYSCSCGEKGRDFFMSGEAKDHVYDQRNTADEFAKVKQTCTERGAYYYSCVCGAKGERLFYGERPEGHVYDQKNTSPEFAKTLPTCTKYGSYYYSCVCGAVGDKTFNGRELGHVFNVRNLDDKYIKTPATESSAAVYYYSCSCGEKGEETFNGTLNVETCNHSFKYGRGVKYDESLGYNVSYDAFFCSLCSLEVIEHGNADGSLSGGNDKVKYYVTGDYVNKKNYKIVIYGTGDMPDFTKYEYPMWEDCYYYATEIIIRDGITSIGSYAFYSKNTDHNVTFTIGDTVKTVKSYGLHLNTTNLVLGRGIERLEANSLGAITNSVFLPRSVKYMDGMLGVTVFYEGNRDEFFNIQMRYYNSVITVGDYVTRVGTDALYGYYNVYLNSSGIGDRDNYLNWAK